MTCNCMTEMNAALAERNTRLATSFMLDRRLNTARVSMIVATEVVTKKRGAQAIVAIPTFCPFCGVRCRDEGAQT